MIHFYTFNSEGYMTFDGKRPPIGGIIYYLKKMFMTPHLDSFSTTDLKTDILSAVLTGNRFNVMEEMYAA